MMILVNVDRQLVLSVSDWNECQAIRLSETADGSFDLDITDDVEAARELDRETAEIHASLLNRHANGGVSGDSPNPE